MSSPKRPPPGHVLDKDGLLARVIKPHSREKAYDVFRYLDTVAGAMSGKWDIRYLELFAGPGAVYDKVNDEFLLGSPIEALKVQKPFSGYCFGDLNEQCIASLRTRIGDRPDVHIRSGNANDPQHIEALIAPIPRHALVLAYLDPEGLDLEFRTIRFLAERFRHVDFLLNMPVAGIKRELGRNPDSPKVAADA